MAGPQPSVSPEVGDASPEPRDRLQETLERAEQAAFADPDREEIAADDAGGSALAEQLGDARGDRQATPGRA